MTQSQDSNIRYSIENKVFIIEIHRPEKKNALLPGMYRALAEGLRIADDSEQANAILIKGVDDCFTSGNDVNGFVGDGATNEDRPSIAFMHALNDAQKPITAAVSGLAIGIGTTMLFHCDFIYASEDCFFQLPFTRLGVCPEAGSSYLLPRQIGYLRAAELMLLGDRFTAIKAKEYGIVNEVLPQSEYLQFAKSKTEELAALPPQSVQASKKLMKSGRDKIIPETITDELKEFSRLLKTPDAQAIVQSFLDRKKGG